MSSMNVQELAGAVNAQAYQRYPELAENDGVVSGFITRRMHLWALRMRTPYPYTFREDEMFYPDAVNVDSFGRLIQATRDEGLDAIHDEISDREAEHNWLFIPEAGYWLDTTLGANDRYTMQDRFAAAYLSYLFPEVEAVHIHPDKTVRRLSEEDPSFGFSEHYLLEAALPSTEDLITHRVLTADIAPTSTFNQRIVSHFGVTTLTERNPAGSATFYQDNPNKFIKDAAKPLVAIPRALGEFSTQFLLPDDQTPAFNFTFQPLT